MAGPRPSHGCLPAHGGSRALSVVLVMGLVVMGLVGMGVAVLGQQPPEGNQPAPPAGTGGSRQDDLAVAQAQVADKYARLEQLLIRRAEVEASVNPQRAALLKRAAQQSTDRMTRQQLETLVKLLTPPSQFKRALDEQQRVVEDLRLLLNLLQSENRSDRLKSEQSRIREYIRNVERILRLQKGVQGRTEGGDDASQLADDQEEVADRTGGLAKQIQENEESPPSSADAAGREGAAKKEVKRPASESPGDDRTRKAEGGERTAGKPDPDAGKSGAQKSERGDKGDSATKDKGAAGKRDGAGEKSDSGEKSPAEKSGKTQGPSREEQKSGQGKPSGSAEKSREQSGKGKPGEPSESGEQPDESSPSGEPQEPAPDQDQNPARRRLQAAEQRMREAQRKLAEARRKEAIGDQEQARVELEKAKAELERILRQLREEEIERTLALLEGRFRRMLEGQLKVYESTKRLDKVPANQRTRELDLQAGKLGFEEGKLAVEADKALLILREEGSSVAFPETVEMIRDDMQQVADRLAQAKVDRLTQGIEEEIIQALEEMIAALQKAQQEMKDKRQPPPPGKPMEPGDRPLVDQLAELKMIRSLQLRVNTRTQRYARLLDDIEDPVGRANDGELRSSIGKLAELERKVFEITRNIVLGKNE